jgi:hypothetical protein
MREVTVLSSAEQRIQMSKTSPRLAELAVDPEGLELARHDLDAPSMPLESAREKSTGTKGELVETLRGCLKGVSDREKRLVARESLHATSMTHHAVTQALLQPLSKA